MPLLYLEIAAADEKHGVDATLDVLEDVIERMRNNASQLRRVVVSLHGVSFSAPSLAPCDENNKKCTNATTGLLSRGKIAECERIQ